MKRALIKRTNVKCVDTTGTLQILSENKKYSLLMQHLSVSLRIEAFINVTCRLLRINDVNINAFSQLFITSDLLCCCSNVFFFFFKSTALHQWTVYSSMHCLCNIHSQCYIQHSYSYSLQKINWGWIHLVTMQWVPSHILKLLRGSWIQSFSLDRWEVLHDRKTPSFMKLKLGVLLFPHKLGIYQHGWT